MIANDSMSRINIPQVSIPIWKDLYEAARIFREIKCWNWMWDSDIFGVGNPENDETGYCCVLGKMGEVFGLVVYLGTEGLEEYLRIQSEEIRPGDTEALFVQKCLRVFFEDRGELQEPDLQVITMLGLKFRGRSSWPQFRSLRPGYFPWYLTESEAKYLTLALRQATQVALRLKKEPDRLAPRGENQYLVQVPIRHGDSWDWESQWLEPSPIEKTTVRTQPIDELRMHRIIKTIRQRQGIWEADCFYTPMVVEEKDRPFYPRTVLCADHESGFVLGSEVVEPSEWQSEFPKKMLQWIENHRVLPNELWLRKREAVEILEPLTSRLSIKVQLAKHLEAIDEAQTVLLEFISKDRRRKR